MTEVDPILERRAKWAAGAQLGQRMGYALYLVAMVAFFVALFTRFSEGWVRVIVISLAVGSALLAPAIVAGYAVKAADREDRERAEGLPPSAH